jgi:hypothetical protein
MRSRIRNNSVRYAAWSGVVLDVFKSDTSDKHILQIMFAKNIYK